MIGDHSPPISHPHPPNRSILTFSVFQLELITALYRAIRARFRCIRKAVGVSYHRFLALIIIHRRISPNSCLTLSGLGRRLAEKLISIIINRRSRTFSSPAGLPCLLLPAGVAPVCHYRRTRNLSSLGLLIPSLTLASALPSPRKIYQAIADLSPHFAPVFSVELLILVERGILRSDRYSRRKFA